jgi:hypothetical protein
VENPHPEETEKVETAPAPLQKPRLQKTLPQPQQEGVEDQPQMVEEACAQVPPENQEVQVRSLPQTCHQTHPQVQEKRPQIPQGVPQTQTHHCRAPLQTQSEPLGPQTQEMGVQARQVQERQVQGPRHPPRAPLQAQTAEKKVETPLPHPHPQVETAPAPLQKQTLQKTLQSPREKGQQVLQEEVVQADPQAQDPPEQVQVCSLHSSRQQACSQVL